MNNPSPAAETVHWKKVSCVGSHPAFWICSATTVYLDVQAIHPAADTDWQEEEKQGATLAREGNSH